VQMKVLTLIIGLTATMLPIAGVAGSLFQFPAGSVQKFSDSDFKSGLKFPIGPFADGKIDATSINGTVQLSVWNVPGTAVKTIDLLMPLRQQLKAAGFGVLYECSTNECGGFDFRFNTTVVDEPTMHVDLGDFRYLAASRLNDKNDEMVSLLISRSSESGFIQITHAGGPVTEKQIDVSTKTPDAETVPIQSSGLGDILKSRGSAVLEGLKFLNGSSELSGQTAKPLDDLSAVLKSDPTKHVILVGHTDAIGTLQGNIALSRKRAETVMKRLIETYGVKASQLSAEGIGYLAPRASNETSEGRVLNRRVEVVLK